MYVPTRALYSLKEHADGGLIAAAASVAVLFSSTPFLIAPVAEEFGVAVGSAGLMSTAQVGAFAVSAFLAGRYLRTRRSYLIGGSLGAVGLNLVSMAVPWFWLLLVVRALVGACAGLLVWLSWTNAMSSSGALRTVASVGPITVFAAAPLVSYIAELGGADAVFALIALAFVPPIVLKARFGAHRLERRRMSPSRSNVVLVLALGLDTLSGSALYVFAAAVGASIGMNPILVSAAFSANALAGWVAARRPAGDRAEARWIYVMALCAGGVAFATSPIVFFAGLTVWGFAFWMSTPPILRAVAAWSLAPEERVGDAQSTMAVGRAIGPAVGALLVGSGSFAAVGVFSVIGMVLAGVIVQSVGRYRLRNEPPIGAVGAF
jgi:DHA1 family inner membrane transport protein